MKKLLLFAILLFSTNTYCNAITEECKPNTTTNKSNSQSDEWEPWAKVKRAEAYYKASGKRVTEYNYGLDYINCPVERKVVNGKAQYRIKIMMGGWKNVKKSNKKGYEYYFEDGIYYYYFNME